MIQKTVKRCQTKSFLHSVRGGMFHQQEGELISAFHALRATHPYVRANWLILETSYRRLTFQLDCAFLHDSEEYILASIDVYHRSNDSFEVPTGGPHFQMTCLAVSSGTVARRYPFTRSRIARSTAFSSNGRYIAWPDSCNFKIFDRHQDIAHTQAKCYLCSAFSPCSTKLAMLIGSGYNFAVDILNLNTSNLIETIDVRGVYWRYMPQFNDYGLSWSDCGNYIGLAYRSSLKVVSLLSNGSSILHNITPVFIANYFATLTSPEAFDFCSAGEDGSSVLAFASQKNDIFLHRHDRQGMKNCIAKRSPLSHEDCPMLTNCIRFSHRKDILAVGLSTGEIFLLNSRTLDTITCLQRAIFQALPLYPVKGFTSMRFSSNDSYLMTGADDGFVRVWLVRRRLDSLVNLCWKSIHAQFSFEDLFQLPLPRKLREHVKDMC